MPRSLPSLDVAAPYSEAAMASGPLNDDAALQIALRIKALADPVRIQILSTLLHSPLSEMTGIALAARWHLTESTMSSHLKRLREAGLITTRRTGMTKLHRPVPEALHALARAVNPDSGG